MDLPAVKRTLKSSTAPQFQGIDSLVLSKGHAYMITGKTIALTIWTFVGKVMSLLFNTLSSFGIAFLPRLSRFVLAFLPRNKRLLISWRQSLSAVVLEPKKKKTMYVTVSIVSPSICHEVMGPDATIFVF